MGIILIEIAALNVELNCTGLSVQEGLIASGVDAKGKFLLEGCKVRILSTEEEATGCEIVTADTGSVQKHITASFLILPTELTNGTFALLFEKNEGTVLTKPEQGCVLPTTTKIKGEICFKIKAGTNDTVEPLIETNLTIQKECVERTALEGPTIGAGFKDKLFYGTQEIFMKGTASLFLTGAHSGLTLGVSLQ